MATCRPSHPPTCEHRRLCLQGLSYPQRDHPLYKRLWVPLLVALNANVDPTAGGVFHDPEVFAKPDDFNPERWLQDDMKSDRTYDLVFGTARVRVCLSVTELKTYFCDSEFALVYTLQGIRS